MDTNSLIDGLNDSHHSKEETIEDSLDNICLLQPIPTAVKVSREGLRQQKRTQSRTAAMINRTVHRKKKTSE